MSKSMTKQEAELVLQADLYKEFAADKKTTPTMERLTRRGWLKSRTQIVADSSMQLSCQRFYRVTVAGRKAANLVMSQQKAGPIHERVRHK